MKSTRILHLATVMTAIGCSGGSSSVGTPDGGISSGGAGGAASANGGTGGSSGAGGGVGGAGGASGTGGASGAGGVGTGGVSAPGACTALPAASGTILHATPAQAAMLPTIVAGAPAGSTVLLADGTYPIPATGVTLNAAGVTLRSESGNAAAVILDGAYTTPEVLRVTANNVVVAELTVTRAVAHPIHVYPSGAVNITGVRIHGVRFIDGGQQFLKVNASGAAWPDQGTVECSSFEMTDAGRPHVERVPGGCYTGGIDVHGGRGWVVRQNTFKNIYCAGEGLAEHAIHFWDGTRDQLVENNTILNCARGIGFGLGNQAGNRPWSDNPFPGVTNINNYGGIIRNNVVWADNNYFDTGIGLESSPGVKVLHNTVVSIGGTAFFSSIDYRFTATQLGVIRNNLTRRITARDGATATVDHNLENTAASSFVGIAAGNLHLVAGAAQAVNQGVADPEAGVDIDLTPHDNGLPDLGADEQR